MYTFNKLLIVFSLHNIVQYKRYILYDMAFNL